MYINNYLKHKQICEMPQLKDRVAEWIQKQDPCMCSTRDPLQIQGHIQPESEGMEKGIPCKWKSKKAGVAILISEKIDFEIKTVTKDKDST